MLHNCKIVKCYIIIVKIVKCYIIIASPLYRPQVSQWDKTEKDKVSWLFVNPNNNETGCKHNDEFPFQCHLEYSDVFLSRLKTRS